MTSAGGPSVDTVFELLAHERRRQLLFALLDTPPDGSLRVADGLLTRDGSGDWEIELRHRHLPKLADAGVLDWDQERGEVSRGPAFEAVLPALRSIQQVRTGRGGD
jgi:hypothetical protein